jgi:tetratricopeptide (TPR) repeat protein
MDFQIKVPPPSAPGRFPFAGTPIEITELEGLQKKQASLVGALVDLITAYGLDNRHDLADPLIDRLILVDANTQESALHLLQLGALMEKMDLYESALAFYARAHSLEREDNDVWYFLNNNLGYCLNIFKRHAEAEPFCREAIRINPDHHNAYKNLAISLEGQGNLPDAVENFILAVEKNAADPRALNHLDDLVNANPEIEVEIPDIRARVEKCRKAVTLANNISRDLQQRSVKRRKAANPAGGPRINQ